MGRGQDTTYGQTSRLLDRIGPMGRFAEKQKHILVLSQRYQDSRHFLQNPTVANYVMGFSNPAQRITLLNYLSEDSPLKSSYA